MQNYSRIIRYERRNHVQFGVEENLFLVARLVADRLHVQDAPKKIATCTGVFLVAMFAYFQVYKS
jgi:hypothetical protein